jgi:hypothetical protein
VKTEYTDLLHDLYKRRAGYKSAEYYSYFVFKDEHGKPVIKKLNTSLPPPILLPVKSSNNYDFNPLIKYGVRSPKFIWASAYSCTHWLRPCNAPPPSAFGLIYEGAIGQPR